MREINYYVLIRRCDKDVIKTEKNLFNIQRDKHFIKLHNITLYYAYTRLQYSNNKYLTDRFVS